MIRNRIYIISDMFMGMVYDVHFVTQWIPVLLCTIFRITNTMLKVSVTQFASAPLAVRILKVKIF